MAAVIPRYQKQPLGEADVQKNSAKLLKNIEKRRKKRLTEKLSRPQPETYSRKKVKPNKSAVCDPDQTPNKQDVESQEDPNTFILGGHKFGKQDKVKRILPNWLQKPTVISTDLMDLKVKPKHLKLSSTLRSNLKRNIEHLLPVQAEVIPWLMKNLQMKNSARLKPSRDICVSAPTGSGKTLAYVVPIIHSLEKRLVPEIRALVIVPVQELALQVGKVFREYIKGTNLKVLVTTGGNTPISEDQRNLVKPLIGVKESYECLIDILVTTPGRLVEHLDKTKGFDLKHIKYLVIDEADRVIDSMQNNWLHHLEKRLESDGNHAPNGLNLFSLNQRTHTPQKLLFSATLSQDPEKLKQLNLFQPKLFTSVVSSANADREPEGVNTGDFIGKFTTPVELKEHYINVSDALKPLAVCKLLDMGWRRILCFTKSGEYAHRLSKLLTLLNPKLVIKEISSVLSRSKRDETLASFEKGAIDMLVCSDLMARGVDIPGVKYVISYEPPKFIKGYIHRAGRTGRAGASGTAVTLVSKTQARVFLQKLNAVNKLNVDEMSIDGDIYKRKAHEYKKALKQLQIQTEAEMKNGVRKFKTTKTKKKNKKRKRERKEKTQTLKQ